MKPWPLVLTDAYPLPPWPNGQRHPVYPWWVGYEATGGHPCSWDRYSRVSSPEAINLSCRQLTASEAQAWIEEHDLKYPIPHPGVRVGQTWALLNGDLNVFTITEYDEDHVYTSMGRIEISKPWHCGASWLSDEELRDLVGLGHDKSVNAYLLADAVCPWLAPWSSP